MNNHYRGLHIVVLDPETSIVDLAMVFDTYKSPDQFDDFISDDFKGGSIVIAACQDDCATNLSEKAKSWFANMGSSEIWNLQYR